MNIWACWEIPAFPIIGWTFSWLHSLPALVGCCVVIYLLWTSATKEQRTSLRSRMKFSRITTLVSQFWNRKTKDAGTADYSPVWFCGLMVVVMGALTYGLAHQHYNVVTQHNVVIYRQLSNGDWMMSSDEDPDLVFRPCVDDANGGVDVNGLLAQGVGYIAEHATWEERGTCKSILRSDLGFWFRDRANNFTYKKVN